MATSAGGAQTITSTSTSAVVVNATSDAGTQIITTGSGADIITASTTSATNTIDTGAGNDTVTILATASGNYTVNGGAGNDTITGGAGNDTLIGGLGNDILNGGAGVDNMVGGDGSDVYYIDIATDVVTETNALVSTGGIDTVNSSLAAYTLGANLENLTLTGTSAINGTGNTLANQITGNSAANILDGGTGNDILLGGSGNDTLVGGTGNDTLTGGIGNDSFSFTTKTQGIDTITDFSVLYDTLVVSAAGFGGSLTAGAIITADQFWIGTAAHDAGDRFIYNNNTGGLLFDADGTGAIAGLQIATLTTQLNLTNADILVIA
ncbi:calcium-binding protein [Nostoc sp. UHCC 0702]|nr:calcium-binding protein [Nostoc sp. UHCC 0702]